MKKMKIQYEDRLNRMTKELDLSKNRYQELLDKGVKEEIKEESVLKDFYGGIVIGFEGDQISINRVKYSLETMIGAQFQIISTETLNTPLITQGPNPQSMTKFHLKSTSNTLQTLTSHLSTLKSLLPTKTPLRALSPVYLSFIYGKHPFKPLTPSIILLQEGIYLNSTYLLLTISKHPDLINNTVSVQLLAFNIQKDTQHTLLLSFSDLAKITKGKISEIDSPNFSSFIVQNLDFITDSFNEQALIYEDRFYFGETESEVSALPPCDAGVLCSSNFSSQTLYEGNVGYEAFDIGVDTGVLGLHLCVKQGRVSGILCLEFGKGRSQVAKLWMKDGRGRMVTGEVVYDGEEPKWVVSAETLGKGNERVKVGVSDLKAGVEEVIVVERKQNGEFECLRGKDGRILESEERF